MTLCSVADISSRQRKKHTAAVNATLQDGELVEGTGQALEEEALKVLVLVRVGRAASGGALADIVAGGLGGLVDLVAGVEVAAAGGVVAALKLGGSGAGDGDQGEDNGGELHVGYWLLVVWLRVIEQD